MADLIVVDPVSGHPLAPFVWAVEALSDPGTDWGHLFWLGAIALVVVAAGTVAGRIDRVEKRDREQAEREDRDV